MSLQLWPNILDHFNSHVANCSENANWWRLNILGDSFRTEIHNLKMSRNLLWWRFLTFSEIFRWDIMINWFWNVKTAYLRGFQNSFKRIEWLSFSESKPHKWDVQLSTLPDAVPTPRRLDLLSPSNAQHQEKFWTLTRVARPRSSSPRGHLMRRFSSLGQIQRIRWILRVLQSRGHYPDLPKLVLISQVHLSILLNGKTSGQRAGLKRLNPSFEAGWKFCSQ
jgi:hypothetical protein